MKLVFIIGDAAVGKMTVGQELMKITKLRLFHNHMTIEPVIEIFGRYDGKTIAAMRDLIFTNFAASDNYGMIFTLMMDFDTASPNVCTSRCLKPTASGICAKSSA